MAVKPTGAGADGTTIAKLCCIHAVSGALSWMAA